MAYTQKSYIQNYLLTNIDDSFDSQITKWVTAVSNWINNYTGTVFESSSDTSRIYDGDGTNEIMVDEFTAITKIEILDREGDVDETLNSTSYWHAYPANKDYKNRIRINAANAPIAVFPSGHQNVKLYATFGHSASVPEDIRLAATMLVGQIIRDSQTEETGRVTAESLGEYSVTFADIDRIADRIGVMDILNQYRVIPI